MSVRVGWLFRIAKAGFASTLPALPAGRYGHPARTGSRCMVRLALLWTLLFVHSFLAPPPVLAASNSQIPLNTTQTIGATPTNSATGSAGWMILLNGQVVASSSLGNGWGVTLKPIMNVNFLSITVPANAQIAQNYTVSLVVPKFTKPQTYTIYSSVFDVVSNSLVLTPPTVSGIQGSTGTLTLPSPAPQNGATVSLSSNQPSATVAASVPVPPNATSISFPIATLPVATKVTTQITASYNSITYKSNLTQVPTLTANDIPPPTWASDIVPRDSAAASDFGPSAADSVNLASGALENSPGPDLVAYNPVGPTAVFSRLYRTPTAANGYASPGVLGMDPQLRCDRALRNRAVASGRPQVRHRRHRSLDAPGQCQWPAHRHLQPAVPS